MPASWNRDMSEQPGSIGEALLGKALVRKYPAEEGLDEWGKTEQEQDDDVEKLRRKLMEHGAWDPNGPLDFPCLLRFLRARDYDLERALNMVLDHLQWRQEERVDHILHEFTFNEREEFLSVYPQGYHQTDKLGHPIYIQHLGSVDLARIREVTDEDRMIKYHIQEYERCLEYLFPVVSKIHNRQIDKTFAIVDAKGIGLKHLTKEVRELLGKMMAIDQNNYPETLYHTCIINAPAAFRIIWGAVKPMLNARTQEKVEVCPKNFLPALLHWIDEDHLPEYLGGKSKGTLVDDVGPWQDSTLMQEVRAAQERKYRKRHPETTIPSLSSTDLVERQYSTLSNTTQYEDPLPSPHFRDNSPPRKSPEAAECPETVKSIGDSAVIVDVPTKESRPQALACMDEYTTNLESKFAEQEERLRLHTPKRFFPKPVATNTNTLLGRVEVLEQGMNLLLNAQEKEWSKESTSQPSSRSCTCCCIM